MTIQAPNYWHRLKAKDPEIWNAFAEFATAFSNLASVTAATSYRGTWASSTPYQPGDLAVYSGTTYIAIKASTGATPSSTSLYWAALGSTSGGGTLDGLTVTKTAQAGVAETIITASVSDAAGTWVLANGRSTDVKFAAKVTITQTQAVATGGVPCSEVVAVIDTQNNDHDYAAHRFTTRLGAGGPLTDQRLWEIVNDTYKVIYTQVVNTSYPGAVCLSINSTRDEAPTYTGSGGRYSGGVRLVLDETRGGATVERGIGVCSTGNYISGQDTSDSLSFYFGTSRSAYIEGSGRFVGEDDVRCAGAVYIQKNTSGGVFWKAGNNSPEGVVTANVGSLYSALNGAAGTTLYVKESGTGNTGWVAK